MTFFYHTTPLLEVKCNSSGCALISNITDPIWFHRSSPRPAFSSGNNPVNAIEIQGAQSAKQRFEA